VVLGLTTPAHEVVDQAAAGTAFVLSAGVHHAFSVDPRAGDRFYARTGAVLDGDGVVESAFGVRPGQPVDDVSVIGPSSRRPLVIEDYGTSQHSQIGTIQTSASPLPSTSATTSTGTASRPTALPSSGWWLQGLEVTASASRGITLSDHMTVLACTVTGNDRLGIGGAGHGITIEDDTVSNNGNLVGNRGWEAGGIKTVATDVVIAHDTIADNGAPGVWTDGGADGVTVTDDVLRANRFGVRVEISRRITVSHNVITGSAQQAVIVVASADVTVAHNVVQDNHQGILVGGVGRVGTDGVTLGNVTVSDNTVVDSGTTGLHQPLPAGTVVRFVGDRYTGGRFQWAGHGVTFDALQALGQEAGGTWQP